MKTRRFVASILVSLILVATLPASAALNRDRAPAPSLIRIIKYIKKLVRISPNDEATIPKP